MLDVEIPQNYGGTAEHSSNRAPRHFPPQLGVRQVEIFGGVIGKRAENRHSRAVAQRIVRYVQSSYGTRTYLIEHIMTGARGQNSILRKQNSK